MEGLAVHCGAQDNIPNFLCKQESSGWAILRDYGITAWDTALSGRLHGSVVAGRIV